MNSAEKGKEEAVKWAATKLKTLFDFASLTFRTFFAKQAEQQI